MSVLRIVLAGVLSAIVCTPVAAQVMTGPGGGRGQPTGVAPMTLETDVYSNRPTFRIGITRVEVSVRVLDREGKPVRGLLESDFAIVEDGQPQTVTSFVPYSFSPGLLDVETHLTFADHAAAVTSPVTNAWTSASRVFAILIDDLHVDPRNTARARRLAREFVAQLDPSDLLLVGLTSGQVTSGSFSRDRRRALQLIDEAAGQRLPDPTIEMLRLGTQSYKIGDQPNPALQGSQQQRALHLEQAADAIARVAASVIHLPARRKTMLFISEGSPLGAPSGIAGGGSAHNTLQQAIAAASVADLAVYPIHPVGLTTPGEQLIEGRVRQVDDDGRDVAHQDLTQLLAQQFQARTQLRDLAAMTGGVSLIDTNDLTAAVERVIADASDHYLLSYEPGTPVKDGRMRKLQVRVARPGVRVETRQGYMAPGAIPNRSIRPPSGLSQPLQRLLSDVVPQDALGLRVQVIPLVERKGRTLMAVIAEADGPTLAMTGVQDGRLAIEQALFTLDDRGRTANATRRRFGIRINEQQRTVLSASALRTVWAIELPPGEHQLRLAAVDEHSGRGGSLYIDLQVHAGRAAQGIAVASRALAMVPTAFIDRDVQRYLSAPPTAMRLFPPDDVLHVTVSGVAGGGGLLQVRTDAAEVVWEAPISGNDEGLAQVDVPLAGLPPGHVHLRTSNVAGHQIVPFTIVAPGRPR